MKVFSVTHQATYSCLMGKIYCFVFLGSLTFNSFSRYFSSSAARSIFLVHLFVILPSFEFKITRLDCN